MNVHVRLVALRVLVLICSLAGCADAQTVYVSNYGSGTIVAYDATTGAAVSGFTPPSGLSDPYNLAVSGNTLYVANSGQNAIAAYNATTGALISSFISPADLNYPTGLAVAGDTLYVSEPNENSVGAYSVTTGQPITGFTSPSGLESPYTIAVVGTTLFVANFDGGTVGAYDAMTGTPLNGFTSPTGLGGPTGLAVSGTTLYVASQDGGTVNAYDTTTGAAVAGFNSPSDLYDPEGIVVSGNTLLIVNNGYASVTAYDATTGAAVSGFTFPANLESPYGIALAGPDVEPTITLTSPATDITVVAGATLELAASVSDPSGILSQVLFSLAGAVVGTTSTAPYEVDAVAPKTPGTYAVEAFAIDNLGGQSTSTHNITVIANDVAAPASNIVTALNGREVGAGQTIVVCANALTANGEPLKEVDFYANGVLFASLNGAGQEITLAHPVAGSGPIPRANDAPVVAAAATGNSGITLFKAAYQLPETGGSPVNIIAVALDKLLTAHVSSTVTVIPVLPSVDQPPVIALSGLTSGQHLQIGKSYVVSTAVTAKTEVAGEAKGEHTADVSSGLATMQYYLSQTLLADLSVNGGAVPKLTFTPHKAGEYIVEAIGTDPKNVATVAKPITVFVEAEPVVTVEAADGGVATDTGKPGEVLFKRTGATNAPLKVIYKVSGTAVTGKEYDKLPGTVLIPAGKSSVKVKIDPIDDAKASGSVTIKIKVVPAAKGAYKLGQPSLATVTIRENG